MRSLLPTLFLLRWTVPFCALVFLYPAHAQGQDSAQFFERTIRPLLSEKCSSCHGELETSGLRVDSRDRLLRGGSQGPAIVAGDPESSLLMQAVRHSHATLKMPPSGQLSPQEIRSLAAWIQQGAVWPDAPEKATRLDGTVITQEDRAFWSFQPIKKPLVDTASPIDQASPIDRLVKRSLQKNGLKPNPPAAKRTLLRRVNFDLIGLPPTPEEVSAFLSDDSPQAFAKVVDGLLASPHFGERWGRYWLDVARYGENDYHGVGIAEYPQAWRYRVPVQPERESERSALV